LAVSTATSNESEYCGKFQKRKSSNCLRGHRRFRTFSGRSSRSVDSNAWRHGADLHLGALDREVDPLTREVKSGHLDSIPKRGRNRRDPQRLRRRSASSQLRVDVQEQDRGNQRVATERDGVPRQPGRRIDARVAVDFAAMLGIRGAARELASPVPAPAVKTVNGVRFEPPLPDPPRRAGRGTLVVTIPAGLRHQLHLRPGEEFTLLVDVVPHTRTPTADFDASLDAARNVYPRWAAADCMSVRTDNAALNELLEQATGADHWI
jgi:hypothetical protein